MEDEVLKKEKESSISIMSPERGDMHAVQDVFYYTWLATYPNEQAGVTAEDIEDMFTNRFSEEKLARRLSYIEPGNQDRNMLVAKDGAAVVGVCLLQKHRDYNQLSAIYVLPKYQGKGIGFKLWYEAKKIFDPNKKVVVHVVTYNQQAIDFYKKLGFTDTGKRFTDKKFKMKSGATLPEMEMVLERLEG